MIPYTSPYSLWTVGIPQKDYANRVLENADLLICVGYDIVEYAPQRINPTRKTPILHINTMPAHINKYYQTRHARSSGNISAFPAPHHLAHPPQAGTDCCASHP